MNKRGFTMVELLAILVILALISLFSVPAIINLTKEKSSNNDVLNTIFMATESYIVYNYDNYKELDVVGGRTLVSLLDLINNNYLKKNIKNPDTNEIFNSNDYILIKRNEDMTFSYEIVDAFEPQIKYTNDQEHVNSNEEFVNVIFDKDGGTLVCTNNLGNITGTTFDALPLGENNITCTASAKNGTSITLSKDITINGYFDHNNLKVKNGAYKQDNSIIIPNGSTQYGPSKNLLQGCYFVEINGSNFSNNDTITSYEETRSNLSLLSLNVSSNQITYYINTTENYITSGIEFSYLRNETGNAIIDNIKVTHLQTCPIS